MNTWHQSNFQVRIFTPHTASRSEKVNKIIFIYMYIHIYIHIRIDIKMNKIVKMNELLN